jgi:hypothetical protein
MFAKRLTKQELGQLREMEKIIRIEKFKAEQVKRNTARVRGGQKYANTLDDVIALLEEQKADYLNAIFSRLGYEKGKAVRVDLETGKTWNPQA